MWEPNTEFKFFFSNKSISLKKLQKLCSSHVSPQKHCKEDDSFLVRNGLFCGQTDHNTSGIDGVDNCCLDHNPIWNCQQTRTTISSYISSGVWHCSALPCFCGVTNFEKIIQCFHRSMYIFVFWIPRWRGDEIASWKWDKEVILQVFNTMYFSTVILNIIWKRLHSLFLRAYKKWLWNNL